MVSLKLILYSFITIFFNGAVLRRYLRDELLLTGPYALFILLPTITQPLCQLFLGGFFGIFVFSIASYQIYKRLPQQFLKVKDKAVLITGCDTGLGHATAQYLDEKGVTVFAGFLHKGGEGEKELVKSCSDRLVTIQLDITKGEEVNAAVSLVKEKLKGKDLWAVVNNAGICHFSEADFLHLDEFTLHMNVNYIGAVRITKAFMPLLKKSKGRLINLTSIACYATTRLLAAYTPSKAALQQFADTYRMEVAKWGVKVICVQPAGFNTGFFKNDFPKHYMTEKIFPKTSSDIKEQYGEAYMDRMVNTLIPSDKSLIPDDLSPVSSAIEHAMFSKNPLENYPAGSMSEFMIIIGSVLPPSFLCTFFKVVGAFPNMPTPVALRKQKDISKEILGSVKISPKEEGNVGRNEPAKDGSGLKEE